MQLTEEYKFQHKGFIWLGRFTHSPYSPDFLLSCLGYSNNRYLGSSSSLLLQKCKGGSNCWMPCSLMRVSIHSCIDGTISIVTSWKSNIVTYGKGVQAKNLQATLLFVDFTKAFDSIHRGKMEQILLAYSLPKEAVAAITILYRNTKVKVLSPDGDTEYFNIVAEVLQEDTLAPYLFIICLDYVLRTSIDKIRENGFKLTKKKSRRYPAKTITDADYTDDIAILANTPNQAETLLHSLGQAAEGIGLHVNAHETEYMCFNQADDISTLEGTTLKLVDKFTYLGSSVSSTEEDIDTQLMKTWTTIDHREIKPDR